MMQPSLAENLDSVVFYTPEPDYLSTMTTGTEVASGANPDQLTVDASPIRLSISGPGRTLQLMFHHGLNFDWFSASGTLLVGHARSLPHTKKEAPDSKESGASSNTVTFDPSHQEDADHPHSWLDQ